MPYISDPHDTGEDGLALEQWIAGHWSLGSPGKTSKERSICA